MNPIHFKNKMLSGRTASLLAVMATTVFLAACSSPPPRPSDPRQAFPITVYKEMSSLDVELTAEGALTSRDEEFQLRHFVREYLNRGRNALTIEVGAGNEAAAQRLGNIVYKLGVPRHQIVTRFNDNAKTAAMLSFVGNKVEVPECGDWSKSDLLNVENQRSPNFGCSTRRNIGLMVTDPGDLIRSKPFSGHSATKGVNAIDSYNTPTESDDGTTTSTDTTTDSE